MILRAALLGTILAAVGFGVCFAQVPQESPPGTPDSPRSVSSSQQSGGITAGSVTINAAPAHDPVRARLNAAMVVFNRHGAENAKNLMENPFYFALYDSRDPSFGPVKGRSFFFIATDLDELEGSPFQTCKIDKYYGVWGMSLAPAASEGNLKVKYAPLRGDDPVLAKVCSGLRQPFTALLPARSKVAPGLADMSVFDVMSRDLDRLVLVLTPSTNGNERLDVAVSRAYWAMALTADALGLYGMDQPERQLPSSSEAYAAVNQLMGGGEVEFRSLLPATMAEPVNMADPYTPAARRAYGARIDGLDKAWLAYLAHAKAMVGSRQGRLIHDDLGASLVPAFSLHDLATPSLWEHATDYAQFLTQLNCLGARFAVENGYANALDVPAYGQCPQPEELR
jgi:hypothetical protein